MTQGAEHRNIFFETLELYYISVVTNVTVLRTYKYLAILLLQMLRGSAATNT